MYGLFELMSLAGLALIVTGLVWTVAALVRKKQLGIPLLLVCLGVAAFSFPIAYTRLAVDLSAHERVVDGERWLTLTGWDGDDYTLLAEMPDLIVLQMANPDVTDTTLTHVAAMKQLRELDLNDTAITDVGLSKLAECPALETLRVRGTAITDAAFRDLFLNYPSLKQLDVRGTAILPETIEEWKALQTGRRALQ